MGVVPMASLNSAPAGSNLRPYVRAFAQRKCESTDLFLVEAVPAQLEQVLNFELGALPGIRHRQCAIASEIWIGGAQTEFPGYMELRPGVESFAIFFQPSGFSQLFERPVSEMTNRIYDAREVVGPCVRDLWNRLGEASSFESRIAAAERFLLQRVARADTKSAMARTATHIFRAHGAVRIADLAHHESMGLRHFERQFQREIGATAKGFARVARFQAAVDAKLASPGRSWLDIAHSIGYYDQMHMIHDFRELGRNTPTNLISQMGDVRPPALASATAEDYTRDLHSASEHQVRMASATDVLRG